MRYFVGLWVLIGAAASVGWTQPPASFREAKALLAAIHQAIGHQQTLYCGCPYVRKGRSGGDVDRRSCGLTARRDEVRSDRLEWEHVAPASWIGGRRPCWRQGDARCVTSGGEAFKGRRCCLVRGVDEEFRRMHNDPHNLMPLAGEINGDRSNLSFGEVAGEPRAYGACDFEVARSSRVVEIRNGARGEVARALLHMQAAYGVDVRLPVGILDAWSRGDPPEAWECIRAGEIQRVTGIAHAALEGCGRR